MASRFKSSSCRKFVDSAFSHAASAADPLSCFAATSRNSSHDNRGRAKWSFNVDPSGGGLGFTLFIRSGLIIPRCWKPRCFGIFSRLQKEDG
eukprot:GILK01014491.1.p1 GENE.GILK01014491.1~~GILK01014491.1.p1  ORF type:complete len:106 (-),score=7.67 GILK01014491.1:33-308(-)